MLLLNDPLIPVPSTGLPISVLDSDESDSGSEAEDEADEDSNGESNYMELCPHSMIPKFVQRRNTIRMIIRMKKLIQNLKIAVRSAIRSEFILFNLCVR